jgi:hypothetical protein
MIWLRFEFVCREYILLMKMQKVSKCVITVLFFFRDHLTSS